MDFRSRLSQITNECQSVEFDTLHLDAIRIMTKLLELEHDIRVQMKKKVVTREMLFEVHGRINALHDTCNKLIREHVIEHISPKQYEEYTEKETSDSQN